MNKSIVIFIYLVFIKVVSSNEIGTEEFLKLVFKNSFKIKQASIQYKMSKEEERASLTEIEPNSAISAFSELDKSIPNLSYDRPSVKKKTWGLSAGINKLFTYGTNMDLSWQALQVKSDSLTETLPDKNQMVLKLSIEQPLLKNRSSDVNINKFKKAKLKKKRYLEKLKETIQEELAEAYEIFYKIKMENDILVAKTSSLKHFEELERYTEAAYKLGKKSKIDLLEIDSKVLREKTKIVLQENKIKDLELKLNQKLDISWRRSPVDGKLHLFSEEKSNKSLKLNQLKYQVEEAKVDFLKDKNLLLPELNLTFEITNSELNDKLNTGISKVIDYKYPSFVVGINFIYPLGNNKMKGSYLSSKSKYDKLLLKRDSKYQEIKNSRRKSHRTIKMQKMIYNLMIDRKKNEIQKLNLKREKFYLGQLSFVEYLEAISDHDLFLINMFKSKNKLELEVITQAKLNNLLVPKDDTLETLIQ